VLKLGGPVTSYAVPVRRPVDLATYQASVDVLRILPPSSAKQRLPRGVQSVGPKHQDFHAVSAYDEAQLASLCTPVVVATMLLCLAAGVDRASPEWLQMCCFLGVMMHSLAWLVHAGGAGVARRAGCLVLLSLRGSCCPGVSLAPLPSVQHTKCMSL